MSTITIAIADDSRNNRQSLCELLSFHTDIKVLFTSVNGSDFLQQMATLGAGQWPQVVLMDIEMPMLNGIDTVKQASVLYPLLKFIMLTVFDDDEKIFEAIKAGAHGYILKDEKISTLVDGIKQVQLFGGSPMSPGIARKALNLLSRATIDTLANAPKADFHLSDRELEILKLMVDGLDYKSIAENIFVSPHTVRNHIANIYHKLHVTSKAQAIKMATKNNLV